jgi:hypothetical protein
MRRQLARCARRGFPGVRSRVSWGLGLRHCILRLYPVPKLGKGIVERDKGVAWRIRPLPRPVSCSRRSEFLAPGN